jgi:hypothetical protein
MVALWGIGSVCGPTIRPKWERHLVGAALSGNGAARLRPDDPAYVGAALSGSGVARLRPEDPAEAEVTDFDILVLVEQNVAAAPAHADGAARPQATDSRGRGEGRDLRDVACPLVCAAGQAARRVVTPRCNAALAQRWRRGWRVAAACGVRLQVAVKDALVVQVLEPLHARATLMPHAPRRALPFRCRAAAVPSAAQTDTSI